MFKQGPSLNTILMVEKCFKKSDKGILKIADLKKILPKQINHYTLMQILEYLEESNKIVVSLKGMTWIHTPVKVVGYKH